MININGIELEFDMLDVETAERYDKAIKEMSDAKDNTSGLTAGASIRKQCTIVASVFDTIFGAGTSANIFGDKLHLGKCLDAIEVLVLEANNQAESMKTKYSKYNPNRAQRRNSSNKK